jgi:hypothetical protein
LRPYVLFISLAIYHLKRNKPINNFAFLFSIFSGVVTMSADSTATSDASDPGSPFSHTSASTEDATAAQKSAVKSSMPNFSPANSKSLKRQAQLTEKCDKKRVRKELCSKNNNVEIKIIPISTPTTLQASSQTKKPNLVKSTLSALASLNVFKNQSNAGSNSSVGSPQMAIPSVLSSQHPPNLAQLSTSTPMAATISKLTDYYKLKKEVTNALSVEKYCNMLLNLQSGGKQNGKSKIPDPNVTKHAATTITPIVNINPQYLKAPTKQVNIPKKPTAEKKIPKIAPVIPVARKTTTNQLSAQQPMKISPKKPVSIAPRIEPKPAALKNNVLQPKPNLMSNSRPGTNGKLVATNSPTSQMHQNQQPTVLLAAIRIPSQQIQSGTQPPPLKIQNGLLQKTTTTTTTTTKLAPLLQFHSQQMIPNLIQLPNLIATNKPVMNKASSAPTNQQPNLYVNSSSLTQQQQQQLFINGAVIKLQHIPVTTQSNAHTINSSTMSNVTPISHTTQKYAIHHQQQAFAAQLAAQQQMQHLFMTTPVLFNTSSIPTLLTSQLAGLQHAFNQQHIASSMNPPSTMPALQPIQSSLLSSYSSSSMTQTTNSMQLPNISTLLHSQQGIATNQHFQNVNLHHQHQGIPTLMKSSMVPAFSSLPPSLTITAGYMQNQQRIHVSTPPQATVNPTQKAIPPLAPASNLPLISKNLPKLISVTSSSSQTSPKSPPPLVMNQKVSLPHGSPIITLTPAFKQDSSEMKMNAICVVPPLPSPAKMIEAQEKIVVDENSKDTKSAISVVVEEKSTIECAKSPILSQPKTIRFPPVNGKVTVWKKCIKISKTGVCNWEKCSKQFDSNSDLLDHLHQHHINSQEGPFICSWRDCKVNGREGSKGWLERHVMSHVGSKPFKCIVERCGFRFSSQVYIKISFFLNIVLYYNCFNRFN